MRQATESRGYDAWYKKPITVLIIGIVLWCIFLLLIVLVWYRCCQLRNQKKLNNEKEFIKIRDGSVIAVGGMNNTGINSTISRNNFWAGHDNYNTNSSITNCHQNLNDTNCLSTKSCFNSNNCCNSGMTCNNAINRHQPHIHPHHNLQQQFEHECANCNYGLDGEYCGTNSGTLPAASSQLLYGINNNMNGSCGGICNPSSCITLQKSNSARSHSPSHHYHYAQLPDIREQFGNDGMSTFCNQSSTRQVLIFKLNNKFYFNYSITMIQVHMLQQH